MKKLEGNPGKRPLPENEPQPKPALLKCPGYLKGAAKKEWHNIAGELHTLGLLTRIDHAALEVYCSYYQQWLDANRELARLQRVYRDALKRRKKDPRQELPSNGMVATTSNGNPIMEVTLSVKKQAAEMMHKFLAEFGMTPASRTRIAVERSGETDPMDELLAGSRNN